MGYLDTERNGVHRDGKKAHTWWSTPEEWEALKQVAQGVDCKNVTQLLRALTTGDVYVYRPSSDQS